MGYGRRQRRDCGAIHIAWHERKPAVARRPTHHTIVFAAIVAPCPGDRHGAFLRCRMPHAGQRATIADALGAVYPKARIYVDGDLIAAARALCGHNEGIACIMGTGSNCCLYSPDNGGRIVRSISPLGYVLGDEGSGSAIGRRLVADALRGILPDDLCQAVMQFLKHRRHRNHRTHLPASRRQQVSCIIRTSGKRPYRPSGNRSDCRRLLRRIHRAQPYAATRLRHTSDRLLRIHRRQLHATTRSRARTPRPQSLRHRGLANAWTDTIPCLPTEITITHISLKPIQL